MPPSREQAISLVSPEGGISLVEPVPEFSELLHSEMVDRRSERHYVFVQRAKKTITKEE